MNHSNNNTTHHHQPEAAAGAENSNSSGNNVYGTSNVRRRWLWCPGCDAVHAHHQDLHQTSYQRLPLRCFTCYTCHRFNPQWRLLIDDEILNNSSNFADDEDSDHSNDNTAHHHQPPPLNGVQPEGAQISSSSGNNVDDSSNQRRMWLWCPGCDTVHAHDMALHRTFNQRLPSRCFTCRRFNPQWSLLIYDEILNNSSNFTNDDSHNEEWDHQLKEEIIWKYLFLRDHRRKSEEKEEVEICIVCQNEFGEGEIWKRLDCGHQYHYQCISQWLLHKNSCPLCLRTIIPPDFKSNVH